MATAIFSIIFIGFHLWYTSSAQKDMAHPLRIEKWVVGHIGASRSASAAVLILALLLCGAHWGTGAGTLTFFVVLMTLGSLVVLLAPLGLLKFRTLVPVFGVSLLCEIFMF